MHPDSPKLLLDAIGACERAQSFVEDLSEADFEGSVLVQSAVERQLEIVGEALSQLSKFDSVTALKIPELPRIIGLRNQLAHAYSKIDTYVIWTLVRDKLPRLKLELQILLKS
jgi:uncharacterized protein with HEPN domain